MFGDYFADDTQAAVQALLDTPVRPAAATERKGRWNGWSAPLRAIPAAVAESLAGGIETVSGLSQVDLSPEAMSATTPEQLAPIQKRARETLETGFRDNAAGQALREVSEFYKPDPQTAGKAEQLAFGLTKFVTKAVGHTATLGPIGAVTLGVDEGMTTSEELARQGVDLDTRSKVGAIAGVAAGGSVLLPVAAPSSVLKTTGLVLAGGPGAFIAQQAATQKVLGDADYHELAEQYDPLDPLGLLVSTLVPAGFGAWAVRGARKAAPAKPGERTAAAPGQPGEQPIPAPAESARAGTLTPDDVDAVMTHNLTLAQDVHSATTPAGAADRMSAAPRLESARGLTPEQRTVEQRFADRATADLDGMLEQYARLPDSAGGKVVNTDLFRELSPEYASSKEGRSKYAAAVHEPSSWLAREQYARLLDRPADTGEVMLLGGGGGSGKSSSLDVVSPGYQARFDAIYDTTLANQKRAVSAIEDALASGRRVTVNYVARDPFDAIVNGVIPRAERSGRTVPLDVAAKAHEDAARTLTNLLERYADDDRVTIRVIDNTGAPGSQRVLTQLPVFDYNGLVGRVHDAAGKLYEQRQLSQATYDGLVPGRTGQADARRSEAGPTDGRVRGSPSEVVDGQQPDGTSQEGGVSRTGGAEAANDAAPTAADPNAPIEPVAEPPGHRDPLTRSILGRAAELERTAPDMVVRQDESGRDITVREEMERIRKESLEGTDTELGAQDAPLVEVAANCALSMGQG